MDNAEYERPNTVSGLIAKRKELVALRRQRQKEIKLLNASIAHLEATIKLFDLGAEAMRPAARSHPRGPVKRVILAIFREAEGPLTSKQVVERWAEQSGIPLDENEYVTIRKRISPCLRTCANQGLIEDKGWMPSHNGQGTYKLWGLKGGDG